MTNDAVRVGIGIAGRYTLGMSALSITIDSLSAVMYFYQTLSPHDHPTALIAQLGERQTEDLKVPSSILG